MKTLAVLPVICCGPATEPLSEQERDELAARFKALADPTRVAIVNRLAAAEEVCVCDLTETFELSQPTILFVCRQNAGRSQMAQALYERRGGSARSAGTTPAEHVHPEVAELMPELADRVPKRLEQADAEWAEVVVTMGCGDACPVIPGKRYVDWDLQDPAGEDLETVRRIRDEIERRVAELPVD